MPNLLQRPFLLGGLVALLAASPARPLQAALITFNFSGTINAIDDPRNIFGGAVHLGDSYTGTLIYESVAKGSTPDPTVSFYGFGSNTPNPRPSPQGMFIQVGSSTVLNPRFDDSMDLGVYNNAHLTTGGTADGFGASQNILFFGPTSIETQLFLGDRSSQIFSSTALPTSLSAGNFTDGSFSVLDLNDVVNTTSLARRVLFSGTVNGINPAAVPEPASFILAGLGLVGIGGISAMRRRATT